MPEGTTQRAGSDAVVTFDGVSRRFGLVTAVDQLSFPVARGETVALLGPNGAGKTTTVELLLGFCRPIRERSGSSRVRPWTRSRAVGWPPCSRMPAFRRG